ncbi:LEA type 2 family protein [Nitrososphaera sp.]|uniref:LEA type 2 family protein n=1 Tax=Nitrososphaera sp. TaxID=1971748 RepID=UPI002ED92F27
MTVNMLVYAAAGGITVAAVAVFFLLGPGIALPDPQERPEAQVIPPVVAVRDVSVTSEGDRAQVRVVFTVDNPNQRPMYLEEIQYDLLVNDKPMGLGQWGGIPEGFLAGSDTLTLIPSEGRVPSLRPDPTTVTRSNLNADEWDSMVDGTATYTISGRSTYRLTGANLQTTANAETFDLTFP